ncbi:hypothetical protein ABH926_002600 [Catenulispora sp. GP43]|uniref:hypothetical protein n=1 Tax=Catenulispora sp. GP43 TaxID=3156263 RepID=UPI003517FBBC
MRLIRTGRGSVVVGRGAGQRAACSGVVGCEQGSVDVGFAGGADGAEERGAAADCEVAAVGGCVAAAPAVVVALPDEASLAGAGADAAVVVSGLVGTGLPEVSGSAVGPWLVAEAEAELAAPAFATVAPPPPQPAAISVPATASAAGASARARRDIVIPAPLSTPARCVPSRESVPP